MKIIFENNYSVGSFFRYKDLMPDSVRSNIVYQYKCAQCDATYIGETTRHFSTRVAEHRGVSSRTGRLLLNSPNSNIYSHYLSSGHDIQPSDFEILCTGGVGLKISESLVIHKSKPSLNDMSSSFPLKIVG